MPMQGEVDYIIEVAAVKIERGKITQKFHSFCACPIVLPEIIVTLTGITNENIANAPSLKRVLCDLRDFCEGCEIVGHNVSFDFGFLNYYGAQCGVTFPKAYADTLDMLGRLLKNKIANYRLSTAAEYFNLEFKDHSALDDACVTAEIFLTLSDLENEQ